MDIRIRQAAPADLKALLPMVDAHNRQAGQPSGNLDIRRFRGAIFGKNRFVFCDVAEAAGEEVGGPIGYAMSHDCFTTDDGTRGMYLTDLFVEEAWRREGAGRLLMEAACARAKTRGASHVWWATMPKNYMARRFYARLGATNERAHAHAVSGAAFERLAGAPRRSSRA